MQQKTSTLSNALTWLGAGISIAEILTGMLFATMPAWKAYTAVFIGHIIGGVLMFLAGVIGGDTGKSSMETTKLSFGQNGAKFFSIMNVLQLVGWTGVMIASGAAVANHISSVGITTWSIVIAALILVWICLGLTNIGKLNVVVITLLMITTIILFTKIGGDDNVVLISDEALTFGAALELSIAMPLSWLPLISDYVSVSANPRQAARWSMTTYVGISTWMYLIGRNIACTYNTNDLGSVILGAGLGLIGLIVVILSTVTTAFLDVYSAGVSWITIAKNHSAKAAGIVAGVLGLVLAIFFDSSVYEGFLYLIGSVFAPMIAIMMADYFVLGKDNSGEGINVFNMVLWAIGFVIYRIFLGISTPIGNTIPVIIIVVALDIILSKIFRRN